MTASVIDGKIIEFGKCMRKSQGYVALAKPTQSGTYWKATDYQFLPSKPLSEDASNSHRGKSSRHRATIPDAYTGLIVSESEIFGERKPEKWFYFCKDGEIQKDAESIEDLVKTGCFPKAAHL